MMMIALVDAVWRLIDLLEAAKKKSNDPAVKYKLQSAQVAAANLITLVGTPAKATDGGSPAATSAARPAKVSRRPYLTLL